MSATVPCYNPSHGVKFHRVGSEEARSCALGAPSPSRALLAALPPASHTTVRYETVTEAQSAHARALRAKEDAELHDYAEAVGARAVEDLSDEQRADALNRIDEDEFDDIAAGIAVGLPEHLRAEFLADTGLGADYGVEATDVAEGRIEPARVGDAIRTRRELLALPISSVAIGANGSVYRVLDDLGGKEVRTLQRGSVTETVAPEAALMERADEPLAGVLTVAWLPGGED